MAALVREPNYPDYNSGANSAGGAAAEMLRLSSGPIARNFSLMGANGIRDYTRFSDVANDNVEARMLMGIHSGSPTWPVDRVASA